MTDDTPTTGQVIPFPRQLRVVPVDPIKPTRQSAPHVLVDHDGRIYRLADLLGQLTPSERAGIESIAPATAQAAWDEAVRRWPALAAEVVAGCRAVE